jgi:hypothetical protein
MLREDTPGHKRLVAYLVLHPAMNLSVPALRDHLKERVPDYMVPAAFIVLDALPLLTNGKLNRKALPVPEQERPELSTSFVAPGDDLEIRLARIWGEVLEITQVGIYDNFFELGGHSLLIPQVHSKLRDQNITDVTLVDLFHYPTIKTLAERLKRRTLPQNNLQSSALARTVLRRDLLRKQRDITQQRKSR